MKGRPSLILNWIRKLQIFGSTFNSREMLRKERRGKELKILILKINKLWSKKIKFLNSRILIFANLLRNNLLLNIKTILIEFHVLTQQENWFARKFPFLILKESEHKKRKSTGGNNMKKIRNLIYKSFKVIYPWLRCDKRKEFIIIYIKLYFI